MPVRLDLDDDDWNVLTTKASGSLGKRLNRLSGGPIKSIRFSTLGWICMTLGRTPGDILVYDCVPGEYDPVEESQDTDAAQEQGPFSRRLRVAVVVVVSLIAIIALYGIAIGMIQTGQAQATSMPMFDDRQTEEVAVRKDAKSDLRVAVIAEEADATPPVVGVAVIDSDGNMVIPETEIRANRRVYLGGLEKGVYELVITSVPVADDASTYKKGEGTGFEVDGSGEEVIVSATLERLIVDDMSKEQLEAVASALEAAGRTDVAQLALTASQEAQSVPGSAEGVKRSSESSSDGSGDDKGSNIQTAPSPVQPTKPVSPADSEPPSASSHTCSFAAVTEQVWESDGTTVTDYSKPSYVWGCNDCGITFTSSDACYQHQEDNGFGHHTYSDTVYPTTAGGMYVERPTGEYEPCPVCGATK